MPLLENGALADDPWQPVDDDAELPGGLVVVSLARFERQRADLLAIRGLGVRLRNTDPVDALLPDLARLDLIVLEFPRFTDGRAYTQARILRERHGYRGRLRATGQVLVDQYLLMRRCGFDSFEIARPLAVDAWRRAERRFSAFYQPTGDGRSPIAALRGSLRHGVASVDSHGVGMRATNSIPCNGDRRVAASVRDEPHPPLPADAAICTIAAK